MKTKSGTNKIKLRELNKNAVRADVLGIFSLLLSAKASAQRYCADSFCEQILDGCLSDLRARYVFSSENLGDSFWRELSLAALLRLLEYIRGEVTDRLSDKELAKRIEECRAHLMQCNDFSIKELYAADLITTH